MLHKHLSACVVAGTQSNCGKTTLTLGLMAALRSRGMEVQPFKCGPDFIDPTLHSYVCGRPSRNLDLRMCDADFVRQCFLQQSRLADISIVEGVMGMYDGGEASSASLAARLSLPVILVVDVRSAAESIAAVVKGFESLQPGLIGGVIFNRVGSSRHEELIAASVRRHCGSSVLGFFPRDVDCDLPSRHLGLFMADDSVLDDRKLAGLAGRIEEYIDLDHILELAAFREYPRLTAESNICRDAQTVRVRIGVARDRAFCFYYEDNLDIFRQCGAELVFFSPLVDKKLPENIDAVYLGGGYPELYAKELSENFAMKKALYDWSVSGRALYAECGGFMYLCRDIHVENELFPMVGVFPVSAQMKKRLSQLGYRQARVMQSSFWGPGGTVLRGHEFHYSDIEEMPPSIERMYHLDNGRREGYRKDNTLGGYLHLHFGSSREAVLSFIDFCCKKS
ncbi:MAG: cobyrinate a,c-diamide synthase [Desulfobulbaceae bacterium]|nr:cobyrinate a,c-diamide synthase [Desulfobulbaceae bacterium]